MSRDYIVGTFVREEKNRFLCTVNIEGADEECYIPSSCRLENFLELAGKEVLLKENQNKEARMRLAVYAIKIKQNFLVFKTSEANNIIANEIKGRRFTFLGKRRLIEREQNIEGYKVDIFLPESKTIVEIKSIISLDRNAFFPTVYSERAIEQLKKMLSLLQEGYKIVYIFVSLNPYVKTVSISYNDKQSRYRKYFEECIDKGMICRAYTAKIKDNKPIINKEIPVIL